MIDSNTPDPGVLAIPDGTGYLLVSTSNYAERGIGTFSEQVVVTFNIPMLFLVSL